MPDLFRVVLLVAVGAQPGACSRGSSHILQLKAVAHLQARPAEAPLRRVAAAALRLPCATDICQCAWASMWKIPEQHRSAHGPSV